MVVIDASEVINSLSVVIDVSEVIFSLSVVIAGAGGGGDTLGLFVVLVHRGCTGQRYHCCSSSVMKSQI